MIVHEYESVQGDVAGSERVAEKAPEVMPILIVEKDGAFVDSALGDVQRNTWQQLAWRTWRDGPFVQDTMRCGRSHVCGGKPRRP